MVRTCSVGTGKIPQIKVCEFEKIRPKLVTQPSPQPPTLSVKEIERDLLLNR